MLSSETLTSFLSTFFGAFLALGLTYIYDRHKAHRLEQDDTRKVLTTIRYEMNVILQRIENAKHAAKLFRESEDALRDIQDKHFEHLKGRHLFIMPEVRLPRTSFDAATYSGKFFLLDQEAFEIVTRNYGLIDEVNRASKELQVITTRAPLPPSEEHNLGAAARFANVGDIESRWALESLTATVHARLDNLRESIPAAIRILDERMKS